MAIQVQPDNRTPVRSFDEAAEAFLTLSLAHGADHVFINPGTDTFPIQEAWARYREQGVPAPRPVMCTHEHVAVSAAHGFYQATGRPQIVIVHVDCGTINAGGALHNAQRGEAGIVYCAGRAPYTWEGELPGSKSSNIHWYQEQFDQAGIVRNFVKWHYELARSENLGGVLERAFQVVRNDPAGPVYLTLPREVLMLPSANVSLPGDRQTSRVSPPAADPDAIKQTARLLAGATHPLIVAGRNGRYADSVPELVRLAEMCGARVCDSRQYVNMPASHPLNVGPGLGGELPDADVVIFLDTDIPYVPVSVRPAPDAALVHINVAPAHEEYVIWNFPADIRISASPTSALRQLAEELDRVMTRAQRQEAQARAEDIGAEQKRRRAAAEVRARSKGTASPLDGEWVVWNLKELLPEGAVILDEGMSGGGSNTVHLAQDEPGTRFPRGGSSLGWALGAAIGHKLARPERMVVSLMGDGCYTFGSPLAAHWTAAKASAPSLTVVFNNGGYNASKAPLAALYPDGAVVRHDDAIVTDISPSPDYAMVAQACGAFGVTVREPAEVPGALRQAIEAVEGGRSAVVNAILKPI